MAKALNQRYLSIDLLRTVAILLMVIYHTAFDLQTFFEWNIDMNSVHWWLIGRSAAILFLVLVGVSFAVSNQNRTRSGMWKRTIRRSGMILLCALLISVVTYVIDPETYVRFGILHSIGISLLFLPLIKFNRALKTLALALTLLGVGIYMDGITTQTFFFLPLGISYPRFTTVDYFPLLPWGGWIVVGVAVGKSLYTSKEPYRISAYMHHLTWPGRYALLVYMIHQPMILGVLSILYAIGK